MVDQFIGGRVGAEGVTIDVNRAMVLVQDRVIEGPIVVGPLQSIVGVGDLVAEGFPRFQVKHPYGELFRTVEIHAVGDQQMVGAVFETRHLGVVAALGQQVHVQEDFFRTFVASCAATVDGVLATLLIADIVIKVAFLLGNGVIVLLDASADFIVDRFLQGCQRGEERLRVFVLGTQVLHRLGVVLIPEPVPWVDAGVTMHRIGVGAPGGGGRDGELAGSGHFMAPLGS